MISLLVDGHLHIVVGPYPTPADKQAVAVAFLIAETAVELVIALRLRRGQVGGKVRLLPGLGQGGEALLPPGGDVFVFCQVIQVQPAVGQGLTDKQGVEGLGPAQVHASVLLIFHPHQAVPVNKPDADVVFGHKLTAADIVVLAVAVPVVDLAPAGHRDAVKLADDVSPVRVDAAGEGQGTWAQLQLKAGPVLFAPEPQLHQLALAVVQGPALEGIAVPEQHPGQVPLLRLGVVRLGLALWPPEDGLDILLLQVCHRAARQIGPGRVGGQLRLVGDILVVDVGNHGELQLAAFGGAADHKEVIGLHHVLLSGQGGVVGGELAGALGRVRGSGRGGRQLPRPYPDDEGGAGGQSPVFHPAGAGPLLFYIQAQQSFMEFGRGLLAFHIRVVIFHKETPFCRV